MTNFTELPGMGRSEWYGLEADTLLDAAEEAFDKGEIAEWKRLGAEAMAAARKSFRQGLAETPIVVGNYRKIWKRVNGSNR